MSAINITPAASPVAMDNLPKIGDQCLNLSVLDRVANEILRVRIPFVLQFIDQLVGAMLSDLGSHLYLLVSVKACQSSHGTITESDVDNITWTWPDLFPSNIE